MRYDEGLETAKKIGAVAYVECSAKTHEGLSDVFEVASRWALTGKTSQKRSKRDMKCAVM